MNYLKQYQQAHGLNPDGLIGKHTAAIMAQDLGIQSTIEFCHFIGQIQHESVNFTAGRENLNYGIDGLRKIFGKYFTETELSQYARQPEKIANRVYANRLGNGNEASGDGWKYRGAAGIQLTGKKNIQAYFEFAGLLLATDPNVLLEPEHYFKTAKWFFDVNNIWQYCQEENDECIVKVSKKVNLGNADAKRDPIGLKERLVATNDLFTNLV